MSKAVQRRRGTTAEHTTFTGALGELTVDTTKDTVVVHDGAAAGGYPLAREDLNNVSEIPVSKLADGAARQLLQTAANGTDVEWTNNVDVPGTLDVTGLATFDNNVTIAGDLTVNGATTTINSTIVTIDDKLIELGSTPSPTDAGADQGGIVLKGTTDKSFKWVDATDAWTSSEHIDLASGKQFYINGTAALPGLAISGSPTTGLYSPGANQVAITTGGTQKFTIDSLDGNAIIENSFPTIRPSLDLAFALTKVLDPRITFTRSSNGTYVDANGVLRTATTNIPRFDHNPTTGESLGLLVEEAVTNLLLRSEEFDNASWIKLAATVTSNAIAAPNGANTADLLTEDGTTNAHNAAINTVVTNGVLCTFSVYAKRNGRDLQLLFGGSDVSGNPYVNFDLANGTVASTSGTITGAVQAIGNGWYRCSVTATSAVSADFTCVCGLITSTSAGRAESYAGDSTSGIYLWGAQLEAGAFPTSYIPTTTAAATRSADVASITGTAFSSWYRQDEGTFFAHGIPGNGAGFIAVDAGTTNRLRLAHTGTAVTSLIVVVGNVVQTGVNSATNSFPLNTTGKTAAAFKASDYAISANGTSTVTGSGSIPTVTQATIGFAVGQATYINGTIRRLTYWPARLSNATLQAITK